MLLILNLNVYNITGSKLLYFVDTDRTIGIVRIRELKNR